MAYGRLDVFWPDGKIDTFLLDAPSVSVGRYSGNTIQLDTDTISRYHFSITYEDGKVFITDLDSANGTFVDGVRLESNKPLLLDDTQEIQIGHLRIMFHPGDDAPTLPIESVAVETQKIEREAPGFRIDVRSPDMAVSPGAYTSTDLEITNTGRDDQQFTVQVTGMPESWIRVNRPYLLVSPNETATVVLTFKPLRQFDSAPGDYDVKVVVAMMDRPETALEASIIVKILPYTAFAIRLVENHLNPGDPYHLTLHNEGSSHLQLSIQARDLNDALRITIPSPQIALIPNQQLEVQGTVEPKIPLWTGAPREHPFDLVVQSKDPSGFLIAVRGYRAEKPLLSMPMVLGIAGAVVVVLVIAVLSLALRKLPVPYITSFTVNSTQVAQGDLLGLNWRVTDVATLSLSLNGTPVAGIDPKSQGTQVAMPNVTGSVVVALVGVNGDNHAEATQVVQVYEPLSIDYFTFEPTPLVRNVAQTVQVRWKVRGAVSTQLSGLDQFGNTPLAASYGAEADLKPSGMAAQGFTVTLLAVDAAGNQIQQMIQVDVIDPTCTPKQGDVPVLFGPDPLHQVVGTIPAGAAVVVDAQDVSGKWLRAQLSGGTSGWGLREQFDCTGFNADDLRKEPNVPPTPTFTPTETPSDTPSFTPSPSPTVTSSATPTASPTHTITPSPTHTASPTHTITPSATVTASPTHTITPRPTLTPTPSPGSFLPAITIVPAGSG